MPTSSHRSRLTAIATVAAAAALAGVLGAPASASVAPDGRANLTASVKYDTVTLGGTEPDPIYVDVLTPNGY
ncbi:MULTISPECIES: hypothetical protein [unclassified Streptomyces]|uniref:hypothetical protein n=1 Tax=unclassified Streptomyces TaxID=2593676 RepID=UPI0035D6ED73